MRPAVCSLWLFFWLALPGLAQEDSLQQVRSARPFILTSPQAVLQQEGALVTVEACVESAKLADWVSGKPIFLNLFDDYPANEVAAVIWEENHDKFLPPTDYQQKMVRITGKVKLKTSTQPGKTPKTRATISLHDPQQITILGDCPATKN